MLPIDALSRRDMSVAAKGLLCSLVALEMVDPLLDTSSIVDVCGGRQQALDAYNELVRLGYARRDDQGSGDVLVDPWGGHIGTQTTRRKGRKTEEFDEAFLRFWDEYPRKDGKVPAARAWRLLSPRPDLQATIIEDVRRRSGTPEWSKDDGAFVPHASTYLNQRRWQDGVRAATPHGDQRALESHPGHPSQRLYLDALPQHERDRIIEEYNRLNTKGK